MRLNYILTTFLLFLMLMACEDTTNPVITSQVPEIGEIKMNDKWNPRSTDSYLIEIHVSDPQGVSDLSTVIIQTLDDSGGSAIYSDSLFDDGAYYHPQDGDVFARDGIFSNRFTPAQMMSPVKPGIYYFSFVAYDRDKNASETSGKWVSIGENSAPYIVSIDGPDSISAATGEIAFQVSVNDSNGIQDIKKVFLESQKPGALSSKYEGQLFDDGLAEHGDQVAGDAVYSIKLGIPFIIGKKGEYNLLFHVEDTFNERNSDIPERTISVINLAPAAGTLTVDEQMIIPGTSGTYNRYLMTFQVSDPEGLADMKDVYFYSLKPDSTYANNGQPIVLQDNGLPFNINNPGIETGDAIARDGTYTFSLLLFPDTIIGGYTFSFYISDKAGNIVGPLVRQVNVVEQN